MTLRGLIIDSGLRHIGGHNFSYTQSVRRALVDRGVSVTVLANRALPPDLARAEGMLPTFSMGAYDVPLRPSLRRYVERTWAQSIIFAEELFGANERMRFDDFDFVLSHTVGDFELKGWNRYLSERSYRGTLMLLERNTPGFETMPTLKRVLHPYFGHRPRQLNALHRKLGDRFVTLTDSEPLTEDYSTVCTSRVVTLPLPIPEAVTRPQTPRPNGVLARHRLGDTDDIVVGYMGDSRAQKGFLMLEPLVRAILRRHDKVRFVIQCPLSGGGEGRPEGFAELERLAGEVGDRMKLIAERLDESDYGELLRYLHVVLLPYYREDYVQPTSGIFAEALAAEKPVVVTAETWMSRELAKSGSGVCFRSRDNADLIEKTDELLRSYPAHRARAAAGAASWRAFHNAGTLADTLLKVVAS
ncbi:MAG: glycosyltransferase [Polyangiales bacterium]